jgi:hypothetical protein
MLPYLDVPIDEQVFRNGEIARTHYSAANRIPGLISAAYNYTPNYQWKWLEMGIWVNFCKILKFSK